MRKILKMGAIVSCFCICASGAFAGKPVDMDGDGFKSSVDCNDNDPEINPDAIEICSGGIDENCDGLIDENDPMCGGGDPPSGWNDVSIILGAPKLGMYCATTTEWVAWGMDENALWTNMIPFRVQAFDSNGYKIPEAPTFKVVETGETGTMAALNAQNSLYQGRAYMPGGTYYHVEVTVREVTKIITIRKDSARCSECHDSPPGHIADPATWGNCDGCHDFGVNMHTHAATKTGIPADDCYSCHPSGCLTDLHGSVQPQMWCTDCHGDLNDSTTGTMGIPGQAGLPLCADCHASKPYEEDRNKVFIESFRHGNTFCAGCHNAPHIIIKPDYLGGTEANQCSGCHATQAADPKMHADCGACHKSSFDPHQVNRAR